MKPSSAKAKGSQLERAVAESLRQAGARARRQPGSGAYRDFPADVHVDIPLIGPTLVECKHHKAPLQTIRRWLGKATVLVHKANHQEPLVTLQFSAYVQMVQRLAEAEQQLREPLTLTQAEVDRLSAEGPRTDA